MRTRAFGRFWVAVGLLLVATGCGPGGGSAVGASTVANPSATSVAPSTSVSAASEVPGAAGTQVALMRAAVDQVNAAAGHTPAEQRAVLQKLVDPDRAADQRGCAPATTTVSFDPAWSDLRPDPNGRPDSFVLPALIVIHTGGRITGTDTAALIMTMADGNAHLPPLCVA